MGNHEDLAASRSDLEQEARYRRVAEFVRILLWLSGFDDGLREFEPWHSYPPARPDFFRCKRGAARNLTVAYDRLGRDHGTKRKCQLIQALIAPCRTAA